MKYLLSLKSQKQLSEVILFESFYLWNQYLAKTNLKF